MILVLVLGAAAGGGFPQWNSNGVRCRRAREGDPDCLPRSQAGLAVSADGRHWFLLNASPDLRGQINASAALHPSGAARSSPIAGVVLTGAEVDTIAGLLCLRERQPLRLHATRPVLDILAANPVFDVLSPDFVERLEERPERPFPLRLPDGTPSGLSATLFPVPGKVPLFREGAGGDHASDEDVAGLRITDGSRTMFFLPGCAAMTDALAARLEGADLVFFDGTLWEDEEMIANGLGPKTGRRMGHMPVSGPGGTLDAFRTIAVRRKILIHLNNSNPLLDSASPEAGIARAAGWDIAVDGMEVRL